MQVMLTVACQVMVRVSVSVGVAVGTFVPPRWEQLPTGSGVWLKGCDGVCVCEESVRVLFPSKSMVAFPARYFLDHSEGHCTKTKAPLRDAHYSFSINPAEPNVPKGGNLLWWK